jgi:hypothetical protein
MRCSDDAEKPKKRAPSFSRISNHQIGTALVKSPLKKTKRAFYGHGFWSGGLIM